MNDPINKNLETSSPQIPRFISRRLVGFISILFIFIIGWNTLSMVESDIKDKLGQRLKASLKLLTENLKSWKTKELAEVELWVQDPEVKKHALELAASFEKEGNSKSQILNSPGLSGLREKLFPQVKQGNDIGFIVFLPSGFQIAAHSDEFIARSGIADLAGPVIADAFQGRSGVSLPFLLNEGFAENGKSHVGEYAQLSAAPIQDNNGKIVAVLSILKNPRTGFMPILELGSYGKKGEAYAFDANGLMVSESRFPNELKDLGILPDQTSAMLKLEIREPGSKDSTLGIGSGEKRPPFTKMAGSALKGERGLNVDGYRGYRGERVVGAWAWLDDVGLGIAVEQDAKEAFALLSRLRVVFVFVFSLLVFLFLFFLFRRWQEKNIQKNYSKLKEGAQEQDERLNVIFNNIVDGAVIISSKGIIESVNNSALGMFGYDQPEDLVGKNVSILVSPEEADKHDSYIAKYLETGVAKIIGMTREVDGRRKDGSLFPIDLAVSEMVLSGEHFFIGMLRDISERKKIENALETEAKYLKFLSASALATNDYSDFESAMQSCIEQVCDLINWPAGHLYLCDQANNELLSTNIWHMDLNERFIPFKVITEESSFKPGFGLPGRIMKSCKSEWVEDIIEDESLPRAQKLDSCPFRGSFGFPVLVKGNVVAVLEFFSENVEPRNERIIELTFNIGVQISRIMERIEYENDLVAAKDEAERASRVKSEFLSRMSHELRTPLNAILGFSQLLEIDESLSDSNQNFVSRITGAGKHLLDLINEVLDLARLDAGKISISLNECPLEPIASEVFSLIRPLAEEQNIRLENRVQGLSAFVVADNVRLRQVLLNLLSNAIKYNEEKGSVVLDCLHKDGYIWISVTDTGKGIDPARKDDLFEPFNRLDEKDSQTEGAGIGLAITKKLVELMRGSIEVESEFGKGSCFTVKFSGGMIDAPVKDDDDKQESAKVISSGIGTFKKALCIEDNTANLELVESIFKRHSNIEFISAPNAELGIELAEKHQPELILMDINLPGMTGDEALLRLKNIKATKNIPVIALSANAMKRDIRSALEKGFIGYITKPIEVPTFMKSVQQAFEKNHDNGSP